MIVWMKFDLPEDASDYNRAFHADDVCSFIWDFESWLRGQWKWSDERSIDYEDLWEKWHGMKQDNNIDLDKLWQ